MMNEAIDELLHPIALASIPFSRSMYVHVDIDRVTLNKMAALGPTFVSSWAIRNNLLRYRRVAGYSPGAIVKQVVDTVNMALSEDANIDGGDDVGNNKTCSSNELSNQWAVCDFDKVITLDKWADDDDDDRPNDGPETDLPICKWTALLDDSKISYSPPFSASLRSTISVQTTRSTIELHLITMEDSYGDDRNCDYHRCTRIIVFNCIAGDYDAAFNLLDVKRLIGFESSDLTQSRDDLKVMFRNALVYVDNSHGVTVSCSANTDAVSSAENNDDDDHDGFIVEDTDSINNDIDDVIAPAVSTHPETAPRSRPSTAVIRIVLREPTPPPTPPPRSIPYHLMASCIQVLYMPIMLEHIIL